MNASVSPVDQIKEIVAGCVNPAHDGMGDVARWAALAAGFPDSVAGATINRFCASSLSATINVAHAIKSGDLGVGIACGVGINVTLGLGVHEGRRAVFPARAGAAAGHHVGRGRRPSQPRTAGFATPISA